MTDCTKHLSIWSWSDRSGTKGLFPCSVVDKGTAPMFRFTGLWMRKKPESCLPLQLTGFFHYKLSRRTLPYTPIYRLPEPETVYPILRFWFLWWQPIHLTHEVCRVLYQFFRRLEDWTKRYCSWLDRSGSQLLPLMFLQPGTYQAFGIPHLPEPSMSHVLISLSMILYNLSTI